MFVVREKYKFYLAMTNKNSKVETEVQKFLWDCVSMINNKLSQKKNEYRVFMKINCYLIIGTL